MSGLSEAVDYNDLGRGPLIMGLTWTFAGLAILAVMLRFYVRTKLGNGIILEDWLMLAAMVSSTRLDKFLVSQVPLLMMSVILIISNSDNRPATSSHSLL